MDELLSLPGSGPLQDLLQTPRAAQLEDMATGQECIAVVAQMCLEASLQPPVAAAAAKARGAEPGSSTVQQFLTPGT